MAQHEQEDIVRLCEMWSVRSVLTKDRIGIDQSHALTTCSFGYLGTRFKVA